MSQVAALLNQTLESNACMQATFYALQQTYGFLSPELWRDQPYTKAPLQEFTDFLAKPTIEAPKPVDNTPTY